MMRIVLLVCLGIAIVSAQQNYGTGGGGSTNTGGRSSGMGALAAMMAMSGNDNAWPLLFLGGNSGGNTGGRNTGGVSNGMADMAPYFLFSLFT